MSPESHPKSGVDPASVGGAAKVNGAARHDTPLEVASWPIEHASPDILACAKYKFEEKHLRAALREVEQGTGTRFEDFIGEIASLPPGAAAPLAPYTVVYPSVTRQRLEVLAKKASARGDFPAFVSALTELQRRLSLFPQVGDEVEEMPLGEGLVRLAILRPLAVCYGVIEDGGLVIHSAWPVLLDSPWCAEARRQWELEHPKPPPPPELANWVYERPSPDMLAWGRWTFDEEQYLAGVREVERTGGANIEELIAEIERSVHGGS